MKPVDQTEFMVGDGVKRGNCLMASLASIIECSLEELPQYTNDHDNGAWWDLLLAACESRGFTAIYWTNGEVNKPFKPYGYHIASGPSPRGNFGHSVVALDGTIVHDPHPSRLALKERMPITSWILIYPLANADNRT
jgi:hypothetical protein